MKQTLPGIAVLLALSTLAGCQRSTSGFSDSPSHGRYIGVGHYAPGEMWSQVAGQPAAKGAAAARPADDEQVIIVMDSVSGEVRQCGNLSGRCIALNPWPQAAPAAPVALMKHAEQLAAEAKAAAVASSPR